jgi:hypothetical protein
MTEYTPEQIAAAALLVINESWHGNDAYMRGFLGKWQPWADTEAGRSDWAVLDTAVEKWLEDNCKTIYGPDAEEGKHSEIISAACAHYSARQFGDLKQRQQATMAAAIAIGEHLGVSDDN